MTKLDDLNIKLFADGADLAGMRKMYEDPLIKGFTTNPTLMRKAGVCDYETFARQVLAAIPDLPVSFEVLSDEPETMLDEALVIGSWADNVYVKVPITNSRGETTLPVVQRLNEAGVKVNVTAILTLEQVAGTAAALSGGTPAVVSVFAGRIADTGRDPVPLMTAAKALITHLPGVELLWASPRELLNIFHAEAAGCDIITATGDVLAKRHLIGKDLGQYSLETVRMFFEDSQGLDVCLARAAAGLAASSA
jgi:transaldolase